MAQLSYSGNSTHGRREGKSGCSHTSGGGWEAGPVWDLEWTGCWKLRSEYRQGPEAW
jgi:hypothetical protein